VTAAGELLRGQDGHTGIDLAGRSYRLPARRDIDFTRKPAPQCSPL